MEKPKAGEQAWKTFNAGTPQEKTYYWCDGHDGANHKPKWVAHKPAVCGNRDAATPAGPAAPPAGAPAPAPAPAPGGMARLEALLYASDNDSDLA